MRFLEEFYNRSPIVLQNVMISMYGLLLRKQRYGREHDQVLQNLLRSENFTPGQLKKLQEDRFSSLVKYAINNVPYYRNSWKQAGLKLEDIDLGNMSRLLPILTKEDVRENNESFKSELIKSRDELKITTSGTTGKPLTIYTASSIRQANYAFMTRLLSWSGICNDEVSVTFAGRVFIPPSQKTPPFWRSNWPNKNHLFSSFHLTPDNIPYYIKALERIQPAYIDSFPSAIVVIAKYIVENSIEIDLNLKVIITSSETLHIEQREIIEKAFNTKVVDQYGSAEMAVFIGQCEDGNYHVNPEFGVVELLDDSGRPVKLGEKGQLVVTGFLNFVMPLIRYRIGDSAVFSKETCKCGRNFQVIKELCGREDEQIKTKDGRSISRLASIFKDMPLIKEAQIVQTDIDNIIINVVRARGYKDYMQIDFVNELKKRVGYDVVVSVEYVSSITRTKGGKFRSIISYVN